MPIFLSGSQFCLLLGLTGAMLVSIEFLRPGWILPGVAGATLLILAAARFPATQIQWTGVALFATAVACCVAASRGVLQSPLMGLAAASMAAGAISIDPLIGFCAGAPFAIFTAWLVNTAIQARRNKRESV